MTSDPYFRAIASAIGLRQIFPMQTNSTFLHCTQLLFLQEKRWTRSSAAQFRMECRHHVPALLDQHRIAVVSCQHRAPVPDLADDREPG